MKIEDLRNQEKWRPIVEWAAGEGKTVLVTPGMGLEPTGRVYLHDIVGDGLISGVFAAAIYKAMEREGWPVPGDKEWKLPPEKWGV